MSRAPCGPSSPGWNMSRTRPASSSRRSTRRRAAPRSIATCVSCPQACITPGISDAKSSPVSSVSGSASMSPRRRIVGPGRAPSITATTDVLVPPELRLEPERAQALDDHRLRLGELEAQLRPTVEAPADLDDVGQDRLRRRRGSGGSRSRARSPSFVSCFPGWAPDDCRTHGRRDSGALLASKQACCTSAR